MRIKKKMDVKFLLKSIVVSSILVASSMSTTFAGHKNYHLKTSVDYGGFGLLYEIITDDGNGGGGTKTQYSEESHGYNFEKVKHYGNISTGGYNNSNSNYLTINFNEQRDTPENRVEQYKELEGVGSETLVFSFPGLKDTHGYKATSVDYTRASQVGETLVTGLNQAILFIKNNSDGNLVSRHSLHLLLAKLSYTSEAKPYTISVGEPATSFKIEQATPSDSDKLIPITGLKYSDYVKITATSGSYKDNYSYFPWRMEKGYYKGGYLADNVGKYADYANGVENEFLTWGQLILQAMLLTDVQGTTEQDFASDVQTIIGQGLGSDLTRTISSVRSLLGLSTMSELVLNMGSRPANYHLGVMSHDMHNIALTVYTLMLMISLSFVGFMIVKMLHQKMLATTNVVAKTTLMEGIKDLAFVAIMLGFFAPLFEMLLELNYLIVRTFSYSSEYMTTFTALGNKALSMESMAGFMVSTMFLSIDVYINFVYLVRAITVSFLFAISPLIIVSYLWSPAQKNLVFGFFRELVGNIFMQSFHAITMTFFSAYNMSNMSSVEALASAYCFVPITQLFRQLVLGNSGGFSEKIGGKLAGQVSSTATGMQKSAMTAKQSKEMFTAQAQAQADIAKSEKWSGIAGTAINTIGTVGASVVAGATTGALAGSVAPGIGNIAGAVAGGAVGLAGGVVSSLTSGKISENGTTKAMGELGSVQSAHADQTLGMGLAELGIGLGVSSYDSAGDRMVMSGLSTIQSGASMKGQSESRMGEGGQYMGEASKHGAQGRAMSQAIMSAGNTLSRGVDNYYNESTKEERQYQDMEMRARNQKRFNENHADELKLERQQLRTQQKQEELEHMKDNKGLYVELDAMKMDVQLDAKIDHRDNNLQKMDRLARDEMADRTRNQLAYNSENRADVELLKSQELNINNKVKLNDLQTNPGIHTAIGIAQDKVRDKVENHVLKNTDTTIKAENQVLRNELTREANKMDREKNAYSIRQENLARQTESAQAKADFNRMNPNYEVNQSVRNIEIKRQAIEIDRQQNPDADFNEAKYKSDLNNRIRNEKDN